MAGNTDGQDAIFPNIRLQCRDLCHAVRRLVLIDCRLDSNVLEG